jgi:hypothetical protein
MGHMIIKQLPSWREMNQDTTVEIDDLLFQMWRETPAWRKLELLGEMNQAARQLALAGLRRRHPNASASELQRLLADLLLGTELATQVFGPIHSS